MYLLYNILDYCCRKITTWVRFVCSLKLNSTSVMLKPDVSCDATGDAMKTKSPDTKNKKSPSGVEGLLKVATGLFGNYHFCCYDLVVIMINYLEYVNSCSQV